MSNNQNNDQQRRKRFRDVCDQHVRAHLAPKFTIQPHPAKTNDPRDLQRELAGGGSQGGAANVFNTPGLNVPSAQVAEGLEKPKSREELQAEMKKLNS